MRKVFRVTVDPVVAAVVSVAADATGRRAWVERAVGADSLIGDQIADRWEPPRVVSMFPSGDGDVEVGRFVDVPGGFVLSATGESLIGDRLWCAELLPLDEELPDAAIVNVIDMVNCLDAANSRFGRGDDPDELVFFPWRLPESPLFRIAQRPVEIFCAEGLNDGIRSFRESAEMRGVRGLEFTEVWRETASTV